MAQTSPLRFGLAGLGGYAGRIGDLLLEASHRPGADIAWVAACDPRPDLHAQRIQDLARHGVALVDDYPAMLQRYDLDAVWLPVPIDLHVPFATQALAAGKAVMLEKPVCGTVQELDQLIEARDRAGRPLLVGFQDIYDPTTVQIKRHLLAGDLGPLRQVTLRCCWPRTQAYFTRADWAGMARHRGTWVLDSPVNNAMAHYLNLALFLMGPDDETSRSPTSVAAELYRAADIENYDTASLRLTFAQGPPLLVHMTHAADRNDGPTLEFIGETGRILRTAKTATIRLGQQTQHLEVRAHDRQDMLGCFCAAVRGQPTPGHALASLEVARAHTLTVNAASSATPVHPIPERHLRQAIIEDSPAAVIPDIAEIFAACCDRNQMLHESGRLPFTQPAVTFHIPDDYRFTGLAHGTART